MAHIPPALEQASPTYVLCAGGYSALIATELCIKRGLNPSNIIHPEKYVVVQAINCENIRMKMLNDILPLIDFGS